MFDGGLMDISKYVKLLAMAGKNSRHLFCTNCGTETLSLSAPGICSWCELPVTFSYDDLSADDVSFPSAFRSLLQAGNCAGAVELSENAVAKSPTPERFYINALAYISSSNKEVSLITYNLKGFMEENIPHRDASAKMFSSAKLKLNKAISICEAEISNGSASISTIYLLFLLYVKSGKVRPAEKSLEKLKEMKGGALYYYARMVFYSMIGDFGGVLSSSSESAGSENIPLATIHYIILALFKNGHYSNAKILSGEFLKYVDSDSSKYLQTEIGPI